jgi:putative FmdB family regulatory protein
MPIYEYECPLCGRFEVMQKASEKPLKKNPECSRANCPKSAERLVSASAFHLKGSGWYKTDYASSSNGSSKSASGAKKGSESSADSKSGAAAEKSSDKPKGGCGPGCGCH